MKGAGLTQGGFYKQFSSKDDLAALASRRAMESATGRWSTAVRPAPIPSKQSWSSIFHRDMRGKKPTVALWSRSDRTQRGKVKRSASFEVESGLTLRFWMS